MTEYIAIFDDSLGEYKFYDRPKSNEAIPLSPLPDGCAELLYKPTGVCITREDGTQAEILTLDGVYRSPKTLTAVELMKRNPKTRVREKVSGAFFTVGELTTLLMQMIQRGERAEADEYAARFDIV